MAIAALLFGEMKNPAQQAGQHGHAPFARRTLEYDQQHEYRDRYDNHQFIFHDATIPDALKALSGRSGLLSGISPMGM
jgi:hypothetical protein